MAFSSNDAAVLERIILRLFAILDPREGKQSTKPLTWVGILINHFSDTLIELNALSDRAARLATDAGVGSIIQSLDGGGYGPLRIPAFEIEGAVQVTDRLSAFAIWRAAMERLIVDAKVVASEDRCRHYPVSLTTRYELSASATPSRSDETPAIPDGPAEPFRFCWRGQSVDLTDAGLRYKLLDALWDSKAGKPHLAREITDVMVAVYGDHTERDGAFKNLCSQLRRGFLKQGLSITLKTSAGKIWLLPSPC